MKIEDAENWIMTFGKYKNRKMIYIVTKNILYLDWLAGLDHSNNPEFKEVLSTLCGIYARDIADAIDNK